MIFNQTSDSIIFTIQDEKDNFEVLNIIDFEFSGSWVLALPFKIRLLMVTVMIFFLTIGSYLKFVIYKVLRGEKGRPINILIWVDQAVHHTTHGLLIIFYSTSLFTETTWASILGGEGPCWFFVYVGIFGITHLVTGNFLMALFRILYMKKETWVKYVCGEKRLLVTFLSLNLLQSLVITYFYVDGPRGYMTIYNFCIGRSESFTLIVESMEKSDDKGNLITLTKIMLAEWGMTVQFGEIACYVLFFVHLYQHNKRMAVHNILEADIVKARHHKNAISMVGQIYSFFMEIVFLVLLLLFLKTDIFPGNLKEFFILVKINEFGLMTMGQVAFSSELRKEAWRCFKN